MAATLLKGMGLELKVFPISERTFNSGNESCGIPDKPLFLQKNFIFQIASEFPTRPVENFSGHRDQSCNRTQDRCVLSLLPPWHGWTDDRLCYGLLRTAVADGERMKGVRTVEYAGFLPYLNVPFFSQPIVNLIMRGL